ncbi:uncharacterized protein LOC143018659 [Oratosquilla oratoria]|uniref:uncharacterized protein LOC143018659 n=1 Tax=Oratosquilla oratoria TaxID=337810 RepID=UPI003F76700F
MDVGTLFTNIPVGETITIRVILESVDPRDPSLTFPKHVLKSMLETCTQEAPFSSHRGELFRQVDGLAMGSPLGVLFAYMYMAQVEEKVFNRQCSPGIYAMYIDDIFITNKSNQDVTNLISTFHDNFRLVITHESSAEGKLPFLDLGTSKDVNGFKTKVFGKDTIIGLCLSACGECPAVYKRPVVAAYIKLALTHCSSWRESHKELDRVHQLLTNNAVL